MSGVRLPMPLRLHLITHTSFAVSKLKKAVFDQERIDGATKINKWAESARELLSASPQVREAAANDSYKTLASK